MGQAQQITAARDLHIPSRDKMKVVMDALTDDGRAQFLSELYAALDEATEQNDLATVQFTINAWWVSRMFALHPQFQEAVEAAARSLETDELLTAEGVAEYIGVA